VPSYGPDQQSESVQNEVAKLADKIGDTLTTSRETEQEYRERKFVDLYTTASVWIVAAIIAMLLAFWIVYRKEVRDLVANLQKLRIGVEEMRSFGEADPEFENPVQQGYRRAARELLLIFALPHQQTCVHARQSFHLDELAAAGCETSKRVLPSRWKGTSRLYTFAKIALHRIFSRRRNSFSEPCLAGKLLWLSYRDSSNLRKIRRSGIALANMHE
jgi:hypothetical protein